MTKTCWLGLAVGLGLLVSGCGDDERQVIIKLNQLFAYSSPNTGAPDLLRVFGINRESGAVGPERQQIAGNFLTLEVHPSLARLYALTTTPEIVCFDMDATTGNLTQISSVATSNPGTFQQLLAHPSGLALYHPNGGNINQFAVDGSANQLTPLAPASVAAGGVNLVGGAADPTGRFVYFADFDADSVLGFSVGGNGALTPLGTVAAGLDDPISLGIDPSGQFLFSLSDGNDQLNSFRIAADGTLAPLNSIGLGNAGNFHPHLEVAGDLVFVGDDSAATTKVFRFDSNGAFQVVVAAQPGGGGAFSLIEDFPGLVTSDSTAPGNMRSQLIQADGTLTSVAGQALFSPARWVETAVLAQP